MENLIIDNKDKEQDTTLSHLINFQDGAFLKDMALFKKRNVRVLLNIMKYFKNNIKELLQGDEKRYGRVQEHFDECVIKGRTILTEYVSSIPFTLPDISEFDDTHLPVRFKRYFAKYLVKKKMIDSYLRIVDNIFNTKSSESDEKLQTRIIKVLEKQLVDVNHKWKTINEFEKLKINANDFHLNIGSNLSKMMFYSNNNDNVEKKIARSILTLVLLQSILRKYMEREINRLILENLQENYPELYGNSFYRYSLLRMGVIHLGNNKTINTRIIFDNYFDLFKYPSELKRFYNKKYDYNLYVIISKNMFECFIKGDLGELQVFHHKLDLSNNVILYQKEY